MRVRKKVTTHDNMCMNCCKVMVVVVVVVVYVKSDMGFSPLYGKRTL